MTVLIAWQIIRKVALHLLNIKKKTKTKTKTQKKNKLHLKPAFAAMHGPHSVFDIGHYTVMPEVCRWLTNERQRKTDIRLTEQ